MKKLILLLCVLPIGCGGSKVVTPASPSTPVTPPPPPNPSVSAWTGTYTGNLNFMGCPTNASCGGDIYIIKIVQPSDPDRPNQFLTTITATGQSVTANSPVTGTGNAGYTGAAAIGPGNSTSAASLDLSNGYSIDLIGSGESSTKDPIVITDVLVRKTSILNGLKAVGPPVGTMKRNQ